MNNSINIQTLIAFLAITLITYGCASTNPPKSMALDENLDFLSLGSNSIALITIRSSNEYRPRFQPRVRAVYIATGTNTHTYIVDPTDLGRDKGFAKAFSQNFKSILRSTEQFYEYLVSVEVKPGTHVIEGISGTSMGMGGMMVNMQPGEQAFAVPINAEFTISENSVTYIGHIDIVNRERTGDEPAQRRVMPGSDYAGFLQGIFDVSVSDRSESDLPLFTQKYSSLKNIQVNKSIMNKLPSNKP